MNSTKSFKNTQINPYSTVMIRELMINMTDFQLGLVKLWDGFTPYTA